MSLRLIFTFIPLAVISVATKKVDVMVVVDFTVTIPLAVIAVATPKRRSIRGEWAGHNTACSNRCCNLRFPISKSVVLNCHNTACSNRCCNLVAVISFQECFLVTIPLAVIAVATASSK